MAVTPLEADRYSQSERNGPTRQDNTFFVVVTLSPAIQAPFDTVSECYYGGP